VIAATLLITDAWTNVITAPPGQTFWAAIFYLVVGEIPATIVCLWAARSATRAIWPAGTDGSPEPAAVATA
jgi:hypothetical protein